MQMKEVLAELNLGNSVAEFDEALERYFVETESFRALIEGKVDVIAGDKGTGKTALFQILRQRYRKLPELEQVEVLTAFNPSGNPVFQRLVQQEALSEAQYRSVWKAYFLSLVGNWVLNIAGEEEGESFRRLGGILKTAGLRAEDDTPQTIFNRLVNTIRRVLKPRAAQMSMTLSETGIPIVTPRVEFGETPSESHVEEVSHEEALGVLNNCIRELDLQVWVVLDRLDEAFQGHPEIEVPALRALLRSYLDLLEFDALRLKLFVRRDLFRKVIKGGFVNLTHVNARKIEIVWDEEDLMNLLCERIKESGSFLSLMGVEPATNSELVEQVFPSQIDIGERKPTTWNWMMSRIRDGNQVRPPRNLIDLIVKAREAQLRREDREPREFAPEIPAIESDAFKRALARLSEERVEDTLLAEAGDAVELIESFRNGKSEHNRDSLSKLLETENSALDEAIQRLKDIGFLEEVGQNFKIPMLYRDGLAISQGKAF